MAYERQMIVTLFKLFDLLFLSFSFAFATWVTFFNQGGMFSLEEFLSMRVKVQNFILFFLLLSGWHLIFSVFKLYNIRRLTLFPLNKNFDIFLANSFSIILLLIFTWFFDLELITPLFIIIFWTMNNLFYITSRYAVFRLLERQKLKAYNLRYMLIVGTNERALNFAKKVEEKPELGYRLIGFADDKWQEISLKNQSRWSIVTNLSGFQKFINQNVVDEVVIVLPFQSLYRQAFHIFLACAEQGITVKSLFDSYYHQFARSKTEFFQDVPILAYYSGPMNGWGIIAKRLIDILLSLSLLVIFSPIFIVIFAAIKIDSRGPGLFVQERIGLNKRKFKIFKFRTMTNEADKMQWKVEGLNEMGGPVFKIKSDPRITRIGKFMRKNSIDELPQLVNVLKGEMSLVGPRPLPVRDYNGFSEDWQRRRFSVKPGITCLWQVNGRNNITFDKWMELDLKYIDNWSLWLDLQILIKTIPAVISGLGAV